MSPNRLQQALLSPMQIPSVQPSNLMLTQNFALPYFSYRAKDGFIVFIKVFEEIETRLFLVEQRGKDHMTFTATT